MSVHTDVPWLPAGVGLAISPPHPFPGVVPLVLICLFLSSCGRSSLWFSAISLRCVSLWISPCWEFTGSLVSVDWCISVVEENPQLLLKLFLHPSLLLGLPSEPLCPCLKTHTLVSPCSTCILPGHEFSSAASIRLPNTATKFLVLVINVFHF